MGNARAAELKLKVGTLRQIVNRFLNSPQAWWQDSLSPEISSASLASFSTFCGVFSVILVSLGETRTSFLAPRVCPIARYSQIPASDSHRQGGCGLMEPQLLLVTSPPPTLQTLVEGKVFQRRILERPQVQPEESPQQPRGLTPHC